jgi:hypothetical protein
MIGKRGLLPAYKARLCVFATPVRNLELLEENFNCDTCLLYVRCGEIVCPK